MKEEAELLAGARRFDRSALAQIYDLLAPDLQRYAIRLLSDPELAAECVAETFTRFLQALRRGRGPRKHLKAYLYRIAHNWLTDYYRRAPPPTVALEAQQRVDQSDGPEQVAEGRIDRELVREALLELPPSQRQVIVLRFLEGWKSVDIAEALGRPVGSVKALQHRGLTALRKMLVMGESHHEG